MYPLLCSGCERSSSSLSTSSSVTDSRYADYEAIFCLLLNLFTLSCGGFVACSAFRVVFYRM